MVTIFLWGAENTQWGNFSTTTGVGKNWVSTYNRIGLDPYHKPYTKINEKWFKDLNIKPVAVKFLEESIMEKPFDIDLRNYFLDMTPKAQKTKARVNKWDYIKLKRIQTAKETINRVESQAIEWEKLFINHV